MRPGRAILAAGLVVATLAGPRVAAAEPLPPPAAERVGVLPFMASGGGTTTAELTAARASTRDAVVQVHDALPTDAEMAAAEREAKDGVADTSAEYRAAGRTAGTQWTVAGHVDARGGGYRLELDACQTATGRVESLAREIDPRQATAQIAEMLALLLRPQGVGDTIPPWDQPSAPTPAPAPAPTPVTVTPPVAPEPPSPPPPLYAENHPLAVGVGGDVVTAFARSTNARGSPLAGLVSAHGAYAVDALHGLEIVANVSVAVAGPESLWIDGGVRYELPLVPRARLFVGPELSVGAFVDLGGDKDARFLMRGSIPLVLGLGERAQIEAYPEVAYAAGGTVGLALAGGGLRAVLRF